MISQQSKSLTVTEISYRSLVWMIYRLGATFGFGLPLVLFIWSVIQKEASIKRLLSIYWKVASLIVISMLLLTGNSPIGYLTSFLSPLIMLTSVWFWIDLNEELQELPARKPLTFLIKAWRWALSTFCIFYLAISFVSLNCINGREAGYCLYWREAPLGLNQIIKNIFYFIFGANWTETLSAFIGYLALIVYLVGLIQWAITRFPKQGRIAGDF